MDFGFRISDFGFENALPCGSPLNHRFPTRYSSTRIRNPQSAIRNRGLVLVMMLLILMLLAIVVASFAFQVNAHRAAVIANKNKVQLRLAAESGIARTLLLLRESRHDATLWYDNEDIFHNEVVWSALGDEAKRDADDDIDASKVTFRFSLVADDPNNDHTGVRYGITDESSKLNLNTATRTQLTTLLTAVLPEELEVGPLVDALLDWRDVDNEPGEQGAEAEYYLNLKPPYTIKNGLFETVEELLLVAGFTAEILHGEDMNRNGLLDPNEDDGQLTLPYDNQDNLLQRGIYPYLTVWSRDLNRSNDNLTRVDLNGDLRELQEGLEEYLDEEIINYIIAARNNGTTFNNPVQLLGGSYTVGGKGDNSNDNGDNSNDNSGPARPAISSPVMLEDLAVLCDRTTAIRQPGQMGLININTALRPVLRCLVNGAFTEEDVDAIIAGRADLNGDQMATVAWLLTEDVISREAMDAIYAQITVRSQQFHIESIGHADHLGMMVRLEAVVELRGHVPQYMYYRDISELGTYPIRGTREGEGFVRSGRR